MTPKRKTMIGIILAVEAVLAAGTRTCFAHENAQILCRRQEEGVCCPATLSELKEIVRGARRSGQKVCMVGSGLSQNGQNRGGEGFVRVKLDRMNAVAIDPAREVAVVRGNVTFMDLEEAANKHGLAVKVRQASSIFGVLSSISTNVHGWDHKCGCIGNTVNRIRVLDENSESLAFAPGTEGYRRSVGSFGGVYLIYEAEIQLTKNVLLRKEGRRFSTLGDALRDFRENFEAADLGLIKVGRRTFCTVMYYPLSKGGHVSCTLSRERRRGTYLERLLVDISRLMVSVGMKKALDRLYEWIVEARWCKSEEGLRNELMAVPVNAIHKRFNGVFVTHQFWLVEYFVEEKHLEELVELYKEQYKDTFVFNIAIRHVPGYKETYAQYAPKDVFSVVICWDQILNDRNVRKSEERNDAFLERLHQMNGTFYLAYKNKTADMGRFYPEFVSMIKKNRTVFSNEMIERIRNHS